MQGRPSTHSQRNLYKLGLDAPEERQTPPCPVRTKQTHTQLLREIKQSISASSRRLLFPRWRRFIHGCDHAQPQLYDSTHLLTPRLYIYTASAAHAQKRTLPSTHSGAAFPWTLCQWSTSCTLRGKADCMAMPRSSAETEEDPLQPASEPPKSAAVTQTSIALPTADKLLAY